MDKFIIKINVLSHYKHPKERKFKIITSKIWNKKKIAKTDFLFIKKCPVLYKHPGRTLKRLKKRPESNKGVLDGKNSKINKSPGDSRVHHTTTRKYL